MKRALLVVISFSVLFILGVAPAFGAVNQVIAGAGPSTKVVELFVREFSRMPGAEGYDFKVPPKSTKHAGGIKNSNIYLFGRTGRPLNNKERALNKVEIFLARLPISFVVGSKVGITNLTIRQVEDIFTRKLTNWKEVGGPDQKILIVGREQTEALFSVLKRNNPAFREAKFKKVLKKDHLVVKFLQLSQGDYAIAFGAKPNFQSKGITILDVEDFSVGVEVGLVYDMKNQSHELVKAVRSFVKSKRWAKAVRAMGLLPPE